MNITLAQKHTQAGVDYPAGATVDLPEEVALWLLEQYGAQRQKDVAEAQEARVQMDRFDKAAEASK